MKQQKTTKIMVTCALLVALQVILARFLSINTTFVVVNFSFLAVALAGILFGPLWGMAVGGTARTQPYCDKCCLNDICKKRI